ncbi:MAG: AMP-binding protein, partial [Pseudomonadota bacterium]
MIEAQYIDDMAAIWAKRAPDAVAFTFGDATLSYGALNAGADRLAQALWANGVQTGDRVGVFVDKSLDSALAIYGIMRAGAAYVPMDPGAPVARLVQIAQACGIKAMVSQERKQSVFEEVTARVPDLTTVLARDGTPMHAALKPPQPVDLRPRAPDDVAY